VTVSRFNEHEVTCRQNQNEVALVFLFCNDLQTGFPQLFKAVATLFIISEEGAITEATEVPKQGDYHGKSK